jgi:polysaccharide biosynthesis transport protein
MRDELQDPPSHSLDEYLTIALHRRWWIVLPVFVCWVATWGISWIVPATYESEATILVERQKVPDQYVMPNVTADLEDRLQVITQQILSRARLEAMIDDLHLYARPRGLAALFKFGDVVDQMRADIDIHPVETPGRPDEFSAFKIRYSASSPEVAQKVNVELASLFVSENVQTQRQLSENTTAFFESQLADARKKMEQQEAQVAAFKAKHAGDLPSQLESNVQILAGLQSQLENTDRALDGAKQQKIYLESLQQEYESAAASLGGGDASLSEAQALDKELVELHRRLQALLTIDTDTHPDVLALRDEIAKTEKARQEAAARAESLEQAEKEHGKIDAGTAAGVQRGSPTAMMQIQSQLKANGAEIANDEQREKDFQVEIEKYQSRLNATPQTEQELTDISRGYEETRSNYTSLLQKQMQSQLATSLDREQQGEQFRIIDPPTLPAKPSAPNRFMISLGGLAAGLFCGLCLATVAEFMDSRVRHDKDLEAIVPTRILVNLPRFSTPGENQARRMRFWMELSTGAAMVLVVVIGNLYSLYRG